MSLPRALHVGAVVLYRPDKRLPEWHDRGHLPHLPAIVLKVWQSGVANLRVAYDQPVQDGTVDLRVFLDHNAMDRDAWVWVFGARQGTETGEWEWPTEVLHLPADTPAVERAD